MSKFNITYQQLVDAVKISSSKEEVIRNIDWPVTGQAYKKLTEALEKFDISISHFEPKGRRSKVVKKIAKAQLSKIVIDARNFSEVLRSLGIKPNSATITTIKRHIQEYGLDVSHFIKNAGGMKKHVEDYLRVYSKNEPTPKSCHVKNKLFEYGYKSKCCEICGLIEWNKKPITLQIHHIDGQHRNYTPENLQILCPNCHSQTDNWGRKKRN